MDENTNNSQTAEEKTQEVVPHLQGSLLETPERSINFPELTPVQDQPQDQSKPFQTPNSQFREPSSAPPQPLTLFQTPQNAQSEQLPQETRPRGPQYLEFLPDKDYKKEYHKIYLANVTLLDSIKQLMKKNSAIRKKISSSEKEKPNDQSSDENSEEISIGKRRKKRRKKEEIDRDFPCTFQGCLKSYG